MGKYVVIAFMNHSYSPSAAGQRKRSLQIMNSAIGQNIGVWTYDNPEAADRTAWEIADLLTDSPAIDLVKAFRKFIRKSSECREFHPLLSPEIVRDAVMGLVEMTYDIRGGKISICPVDKVDCGLLSTELTIENSDWLRDRKIDRDFPIFACFETMLLG